MNNKIVFGIWVFVFAVIFAQPVGIAHITFQVADIPDGDNGYFIRANCQNNGDGTFVITMDVETMKSSEWQVVMMHEIGHTRDWNWSEEECDNFANSMGVGYIHDATY